MAKGTHLLPLPPLYLAGGWGAGRGFDSPRHVELMCCPSPPPFLLGCHILVVGAVAVTAPGTDDSPSGGEELLAWVVAPVALFRLRFTAGSMVPATTTYRRQCGAGPQSVRVVPPPSIPGSGVKEGGMLLIVASWFQRGMAGVCRETASEPPVWKMLWVHGHFN